MMKEFTHAVKIVYEFEYLDGEKKMKAETSKDFRVRFDTSLTKRQRKGKILMVFKNGKDTWKVRGQVIELSKRSIKIRFNDPIHKKQREIELIVS
jgi:hypothetical protein